MTGERCFPYGEKEIFYLKSRDEKMGELIEMAGFIRRPVDPDLFSSVIHQIIGQQISTKAQETIWERMRNSLGPLTARKILKTDPEVFRGFGISPRKTEYILEFAEKVKDGSFNLEELSELSDEEAVKELTSLKGVGVWTAEMILLFGMERPDILSYEDFGIRKGLCLLYGLSGISRETFEEYRGLYHPYGSVASLYLWALAGGAVPDLMEEGKNGK